MVRREHFTFCPLGYTGATGRVGVYDPCSCPSCVAGKRWFYCERLNETHIADVQYPNDSNVPGDEFGDYASDKWRVEAVRWAQRQWPGKVFVYIGRE